MSEQNKVPLTGRDLMKQSRQGRQRHPIMSIQEVADYFKLSVTTVYRMAQQGRLPCIKVGR